MGYVKQAWVDGAGGATPLSAARLAYIETGLETASNLVPIRTIAASEALTLADAGSQVEVNSASAIAVTIPPNASVAFAVGTVVEVSLER